MSFFTKGKVEKSAVNIIMEYDPSLNHAFVKGLIIGITSKNPQTAFGVNQLIKMGKKYGTSNEAIAMHVLSIIVKMFEVDMDIDPRTESIMTAIRNVSADHREMVERTAKAVGI